MKRLLVLALAILAATQADGQSSATACWLGATWTTCFKPVVHTSMEGPSSPTVSGYLASGDWATFNAAVAPTRTINTTAPLAGGGPLSSDLTLSIPAATATVSGYLASGDWRIFNNASGAKATATSNGFLASADWATFNGKGGAYTQGNLTEATSAVLTLSGGTNSVFGSGTTIQVTKSDAAHPGYLASADWVLFNASVPGGRTISTTAPITGGGDLTANRTIAISAASSSAVGSVSYEDSGTFSATFTGPCSSGALSVHYSRVGKNVCLFVPGFSCTSSVGTSFAAGAGTVPSALRPTTANVITPGIVQDVGVSQTTPGTVSSFTNGDLEVFKNYASANFSASGTAALVVGASLCYTIN